MTSEIFAGELLLPSDPAYHAARRVANDAIDRRPAAIVRCAGADDVVAALRHARESGLPVTVRAGGHGADGFAVADGALTIDLSPMRGVTVDPGTRLARVEGGATWAELDAATAPHGLAVTGARMPSVGVAGFTLGSGSGWLERRLGLAADSLTRARVVTAAGEVVTAAPDENRELFWALRGGGPSFGIVVELELALHPVGPMVTGGMLGWPAERFAEVAARYVSLLEDSSDDLGGGLALLDAPPAPFVPEALRGAPVVAAVVLWTGAAEDAEAAVAPLRELAPAFDAVGPMPYLALQGMFEPPAGVRVRGYGEGGFLDALPAEALAVVAEHGARRPTVLGNVLLQPMGGAFARSEADTPLTRRDAAWVWQTAAAWTDPGLDDSVREWAAGLRAALEPWSGGDCFPNFIPRVDPGRLEAAYAPEAWERLRAVRAEWDPDGVLAAGHAIPLGDPVQR